MSLHKVVVFGGSGFVGRYLVGLIADTGATIVVPTRRPERAKHLATCGSIGQVTMPAADLRDAAAVRAAVRGADTVINLVGIIAPYGRQNFQSIHVDGPALVARLSAEAGVARLVHMSANGADAGSRSSYARSKAAGEDAVRQAFNGAVVMRPSIIVGAEDAFFNRFAGLSRWSPFLPLIGGGETKFQPIFVGDVARAIMAALGDDAAAGRTFLLGGPKVYTFRELMELMLAEIGRHRALIRVPYWVASLLAILLGLGPKPLLTRDQVKMLRADNVVAPQADESAIGDLGVRPVAIEAVVGTYLARYRPAGLRRLS